VFDKRKTSLISGLGGNRSNPTALKRIIESSRTGVGLTPPQNPDDIRRDSMFFDQRRLSFKNQNKTDQSFGQQSRHDQTLNAPSESKAEIKDCLS